jgi:hypothetical protein
VQVGTDEGRGEAGQKVPNWAPSGNPESEGADRLVGAEDFLLPFLDVPFSPLLSALPFPLVGTVDGILEGVSEGGSDSIDGVLALWGDC